MNTPKVFSYIRFSSGRQALGTSVDRQQSLLEGWCKQHNLTLDDSLTITDFGVSAFRGTNASKGALSVFLKAALEGKIPRGSILLLESLDRLSRAALTESMLLLVEIVRAGITVVSIKDSIEWTPDNINESSQFILSAMLFARANDESEKKSERVSAAFQLKRQAGHAVVSRMHGGGWVKPMPDKSAWEIVEDKAESVRKVFEYAAGGCGGVAIARMANEEKWALPFRERKTTNGWEHTGISRLLRDRRVLGEWQPKRIVNGILVADGDPVENYFPRVIDEDLWTRVQIALKGRPGPKRIRGIFADIFSGLLYCSCGARMERKAKSERGHARYYCQDRKRGKTDCPTISETAIIQVIFSNIGKFEEEAFRDDSLSETLREKIRFLDERANDIRTRANNILVAIETGTVSPTLMQRLTELEREEKIAKDEANSARESLGTIPRIGGSFGDDFAEKAAEIIDDKMRSADRLKLAQALNRVVSKIEFHGEDIWVTQQNGVGFFARIPREFLERAKRRDAGMSREEIAAKAGAM